MKALAAALFRLPLIGPLVKALWQLARRLALHHGTGFVTRRYLSRHSAPKLHLGAGGAGLTGWLNTDLFPERWPVVRLDATRPFPFSNDVFRHVFSEHMIEHLPLAGARNMVAESFRVLAPGGWLRVATPDLARVVLLHGSATPEHQRYLTWSIRHNRLSTDLPASAVVINSLFHDHGHQFLFDEATLAALLRNAGFVDIRRCASGESEHAEFLGVEVHQVVIGAEANAFETLIIEARKP